MRNRFSPVWWFPMLVALLAFSGCGAPLQYAAEKPNIVFILADDMRLDEFEYMPQTQRLLAEQGLTFENSFVTTPLCCPSRATILRGQYAHNHQVLMNANLDGGFEKFRSLGREDSTVATWLRSGGYKTVLLGKYLNHYPQKKMKRTCRPAGTNGTASSTRGRTTTTTV
jgi:N-acetylglucosamine-6-sulfatase